MDERTLKRLLIITAVAIVIILLAKSVMTRSYASLNKAAEARKQSALQQLAASVPPVTASLSALLDPAPASEVPAAEPAASAVVESGTR